MPESENNSPQDNPLLDNPYYSAELAAPVNQYWSARRKAADACRSLIENLVTTSATPELLEQVAAVLGEQAARLETEQQFCGRLSYEGAGDHGGIPEVDYEVSPLNGQSNPIAPSMVVHLDGEKVHGRATLGWPYEGPPGCVHGGFIAALFDQLLGVGQMLSPAPGFTGTLSVRYLKPTPLNTELRLEGWLDRVDGRKAFLSGEMWAGDVKTATCEGVFINVPEDTVVNAAGGADT